MSAETAVEHAQAQAPSAGDYIVHHLQSLQMDFSLQSVKQSKLVDFGVFNADSVFFSVVLGALACWLMWLAARKATAGVPGRFQAAVEWLVEMVADQAKGIVHNAHSRKTVAPLALIVFVWIFLMNAMDLLPVDLLPWMWGKAYALAGHDPHHAYLRVLPTADLSVAMGLSVSVLLLCLYYNLKIKKPLGWAHELVTAPFGTSKNPLLAALMGAINLAMQLVEFVAKTVSHGMRLFGNMFAGELIFMLIALMGGAWSLSGTGIGLAIGHVLAGTVWAIFHLLIITLQAFIFMMLTLIYIGQAHDAH